MTANGIGYLRKKTMKMALCLIVKPTNQEAELLDRCLTNVKEAVDGIFITQTGHNDKVVEVCKKHGAVLSSTPWEHNFAKARNFNFSQVPKDFDYIMWLDADDMVRGIEKLRTTIEANPDKDGFAFNYLYAFDEQKKPIVVHLKTQVIRNDGCVEWAGRLHEDFKENRELKIFIIKGIERIHLSDEARFDTAKERNLEVARKQMEEEPNDPRSYWNLGNALKSMNKNEESLEVFDKYLELSQSDDEKYIVRLRKAESYWQLGQKSRAIDEARYAIGTKPQYPDAYHLLGSLYFESNKLVDAKESYLMGLTRKPPYTKILVYNPRDYDYVPLMNLAKVYFALSLPIQALECLKACYKIIPEESLKKTITKIRKEAKKFEEVAKKVEKLRKIEDKELLKAELDKLPKEFQAHPAVCNLRNTNFIKTESSGKDLVIFCGMTEDVWTPETALKKGIGGSEEAVIHLAKRFQRDGWNVTVYNNCGHEEQVFDDVKYKPFWSWNYRDKQDVVVLWRSPMMVDYDINASKILVDLHDVIKKGEFTESRLKKIHKVMVKSEFHKSLFDIPEDKIVVIPNGIEEDTRQFEKDPYLIINTSSPDRGLSACVDIFADVKKQVPEAKMKWAYGWKVWNSVHGENMKHVEWRDKIQAKMKEVGIEELGRISHKEIAELTKRAKIFLYPTEFAEIHCISALKAQLYGALPITTDFAALNETVQYGTKIHSYKTKDNWCLPYQFDFSITDVAQKDAFVKKVVESLNSQVEKESMVEFARKFNWDLIAKRWEEVL